MPATSLIESTDRPRAQGVPGCTHLRRAQRGADLHLCARDHALDLRGIEERLDLHDVTQRHCRLRIRASVTRDAPNPPLQTQNTDADWPIRDQIPALTLTQRQPRNEPDPTPS